jgi:hypothetical membrane protein
MLAILKNPLFFQILSLAGALSAMLGSLAAGLAYRGRLGERYSPLNHFISELGEAGVSRLDWAFNLGLILCGLCLLPASVSLGLILPGVWSKLGMIAGIVTGASIALVGVFPMNKLTPHIRAAVTYFRLGLVMVTFFTLAIALQPTPPVLSRWFCLAGLPAILAYSYFLLYSRISYAAPQNPLASVETARPRVWRMAAAEWAIFITTVPWVLAIALGL